ncbi:MAG: Fic family protein [Proteobacteria bacterium]|nr:MAG: Fic family protein [Pseudomonadota bacterium]
MEISSDTLTDLRALDLAVASKWHPLAHRLKLSIWCAGIEKRFAASNNGLELMPVWAQVSEELLRSALSQREIVSETMARSINARLRGENGLSSYRNYDAVSGDMVFTPADSIGSQIAEVLSQVSNINHPLIAIAFFAQRLLSVHPFQDGNGRTTRLITDLLLQHAGYPPPQFLSPLDFLIARPWDDAPGDSLEHSVLLIAGAVERGLSQACP